MFLPASALAQTVRVAVLGLFRPVELEVRPAPHTALSIEGARCQVIFDESKKMRLRVAGQRVQCVMGEYTFTAPVIRAGDRQGGPGEFILSVPARIAREYRGGLEISVHDGKLLAVVAMDLETAVAAAVLAESSPAAPLEAVKAQAIVTRSYYLAAPRRHVGADICDTTHCQFLREVPAAGAPALVATQMTRGLVLMYRGQVLPALFSASCGGRTRSLDEAGFSPHEYPYYSVTCEYCLHHAPRWSTTLNPEDTADLLKSGLTEATRLRVDRKTGWSTVPGNNYELDLGGETIVVRGRGQGHGIGLCQFGSNRHGRRRRYLPRNPQLLLPKHFPGFAWQLTKEVGRRSADSPSRAALNLFCNGLNTGAGVVKYQGDAEHIP